MTKNGFRILDAAVPDEKKRWLEMWRNWRGREVSAHPDYVRLFSTSEDRTLCATLSGPTGAVIFPLILRQINSEVWASDLKPVFDLTTPYGYGGPFVTGSPPSKEFWSALEDWALQEGVVTLFARLSLFPEQLMGLEGNVQTRSLNIVRTLCLSQEELWMDYKHKVRKNVKTAQRAGLSVMVDLVGERVADFLNIYHHTLDRRSADNQYYFSDQFFANLLRDLKGSFAFFHALSDQNVVASELVLMSDDYLYSFLGGTLADSFALRPNDLLKHEISLWGTQHKKKAFVLGGGYQGCDGIFQYKKTFAPHGEVPFRVLEKVFDPGMYAWLLLARENWELTEGREWKPTDYFPGYRDAAGAQVVRYSELGAKPTCE